MSESPRNWLLGGAIGSGKSTVRRLLETSGVNTIDADSIGHEVLEPNGPAFAGVASRWPEVVVEGVIDRGVLGDLVFSDPGRLDELESLTHPHIFGRITGMLQQFAPPVVVEIPLIRTAPPGDWGRIIVDCDDANRLARLLERGMSRDRAVARMSAQPSRAEWLSVADLVVPNHGDLATLTQAVESILTHL